MRKTPIFIVLLVCVIGIFVFVILQKEGQESATQFTQKQALTKIKSTFPYEKNKVYGIDISQYQDSINWQKLAESEKISFVYIRSSVGITEDARLQINHSGATNNSFLVGFYHFYRYWQPVKPQFLVFKKIYNTYSTGLLPVIDVEKCKSPIPKHIADSVALFVQLCEQNLDVTPIIYSSNNFFEVYLASKFQHHKKWIANYREYPSFAVDSTPFQIWQFSDNNKLCGIKGNVDMNIIANAMSLCDIQKKQISKNEMMLRPYDTTNFQQQMKKIISRTRTDVRLLIFHGRTCS